MRDPRFHTLERQDQMLGNGARAARRALLELAFACLCRGCPSQHLCPCVQKRTLRTGRRHIRAEPRPDICRPATGEGATAARTAAAASAGPASLVPPSRGACDLLSWKAGTACTGWGGAGAMRGLALQCLRRAAPDLVLQS